MDKKKRRLETFSVYDHSGMERHLEKMASRGWMLEKIGNLCWTYRKIEPQKLTFYVSCYPAASEYAPEQTVEQVEFQEMCEHTGWRLAASVPRMQVFYNEQENPAPIMTEPEVEIEAIHRAVWKNFFPAQLLLGGLGILELFIQLLFISGNLMDLLTSTTRQFGITCWVLVLVLVLLEFAAYYTWRHKALKAAENGEFLATPSTKGIQKAVLLFVFGFYGYWWLTVLFDGSSVTKFSAVLMAAYMVILFAAVNGTKKILQKKKVAAETNKIITLAVDFVLAFLMIGIITIVVSQSSEKGWFEDEELETYEFIGRTFTVYKDLLPLTVEDLTGEAYEGYSYEKDVEKSFLAIKYDIRQWARFDIEDDSHMPNLNYTIYEAKIPWVYERCKEILLAEEQDEMQNGEVVYQNHYEPVEASAWGAVEVYQLFCDGDYLERYLLCYEDKIVEFRFYGGLTDAQKAIVGEKLQ